MGTENGGGVCVLHEVTSPSSAIQESLASGLRPLEGCRGGSLLWPEGLVHICPMSPAPSPSSDLPASDLGPDAASGTDMRLVAWGWAPACSPNPELLFVTNCFVCSVGDT